MRVNASAMRSVQLAEFLLFYKNYDSSCCRLGGLVRLADLATPMREASSGKIQKGSARRSATMITLQF